MANKSWISILIAVVSLIVAFLAIGQAITMAWLSSLPAQEPRLVSLSQRFWLFLTIGLIALAISAEAVMRWVRRVNRRDRLVD